MKLIVLRGYYHDTELGEHLVSRKGMLPSLTGDSINYLEIPL